MKCWMLAKELFFWMSFVKDVLVAQCGHREKGRSRARFKPQRESRQVQSSYLIFVTNILK